MVLFNFDETLAVYAGCLNLACAKKACAEAARKWGPGTRARYYGRRHDDFKQAHYQ
jgi:hypothetical protein